MLRIGMVIALYIGIRKKTVGQRKERKKWVNKNLAA